MGAARWWVLAVLSGLGCQMVADTTSRERPCPVAPASEIRLGLEWVDGRDDRSRVGLRADSAPLPLPPLPTSRTPAPPAVPDRLPSLSVSSPAAATPQREEAPRRNSSARASEPRRDSPERVLTRYLALLHESERLEKAFGYGRFRPSESLLAWSDPELPVLARDREQFGDRLERFGPKMFFRPAEKSLAELDFYRDARLGLQDFKGRVLHSDGDSGLGAWTARFRGQSPSEMLEISYRLGGLRVGSTAGSLRASCDSWLLPWLRLELASRFPYDPTETASAGGGLHCYVDRFLDLHLVGSTQTNRDMLPSLFMPGDPTEPLGVGFGLYLIYRF